MASLSLFHLRAIFYAANIGIYFISPQKQLYFFSHRNEFQDHFYPRTKKTPTSASHCSAANRAPPEVRKRAAGPTEEQSGTIAGPPLRSFAQRRSDRKKKEQTAQALGTFSTYRGAFRRSPPPRPPPPRRHKKRGRRNRRKSSRANARASPSFCFSPSPIGSNSVVHNALWVKISHILTQRNHHTTHSGSTACG